MDDEHFFQLLHRFGLSRAGYRKVRKGVKKRIRRHMLELRCHSVEQYVKALEESRELRTEFDRLMTVSISRFFRDRALWQAVENEILPDLILSGEECINVWTAGCACGEEVYSFRIVWERLRGPFEYLPDLKLLATDINLMYLTKAKRGIYPHSSLREVSEEIRLVYFEPLEGGKKYRLDPSLSHGVLWKEHNLLTGRPPGTDFHLIFLRNNLLTYYDDEIKLPALGKIVDSLVPGGFLVVGTHEKVPFDTFNLIPCSDRPYILQKTDVGDRVW